MSQMVTRKSGGGEEKEKRHTDSPVKDMKKKMAANAEKEKQAADKTVEKQAEKPDTSKQDKKTADNKQKTDKNGPVVERSEKKDTKEKKEAEKKESQEKRDDSKAEKSGKSDKEAKPKEKEKDTKPKQNGAPTKAHNGVSDVTLSAAAAREPSVNGGANGDVASEEEGVLVIDSEPETERDELFPELAYDESDGEGAPPAGDRSLTRRSQVKPTRTPETPRPASDKQIEKETPQDDQTKDKEKVLKMTDDAKPRSSSTDRKLRSSDTVKADQKKQEKEGKKSEGVNKGEGEEKGSGGEKKGEESKGELDVVVEVDNEEECRKRDTNYSKSRVKVSPYRRSARLADQTASSVTANYTGNNTTMEMDITETSSFISEDTSVTESPYLSGLRGIKGRRSYRPLKEITLRHVVNKTVKTAPEPTRPMAPVVGRKRKPDTEDSIEVAIEAQESTESVSLTPSVALAKRMRLLDRIAMPFRRNTAVRSPEIVGINTDLPQSAPVSSPEATLPETLKAPLSTSSPIPLAPGPADRDGKRCIVM